MDKFRKKANNYQSENWNIVKYFMLMAYCTRWIEMLLNRHIRPRNGNWLWLIVDFCWFELTQDSLVNNYQSINRLTNIHWWLFCLLSWWQKNNHLFFEIEMMFCTCLFVKNVQKSSKVEKKVIFWRKCINFDETPIDRRFTKKV